MSDRVKEARAVIDQWRHDRWREVHVERQPDLFSQDWTDPQSPSDQWKAHALEQVRAVALELDEFTIEDVSPRIGATVDRRALGAVMLAASRKGWCEAGGWVNGDASRHGRPIRQWISKVRRAA